jgi:hypothetical protein
MRPPCPLLPPTANSKEEVTKEILDGNNAEFFRNFAMFEDQFDETHKPEENTAVVESGDESWTSKAARYVSMATKARGVKEGAPKVGIAVIEALKNTMRKSQAGRRAVQKVIQRGAQQLANAMQMAENVNAAANFAGAANFRVNDEGIRRSARVLADLTGSKVADITKKMTESDGWKRAVAGNFGIKDLNALPIVGGLSKVDMKKQAAEKLSKLSSVGGAILMYGPEAYAVATSIYGAYSGKHSTSTAIVQVTEATGRLAGAAAGGAGGAIAGRELGKAFFGEAGEGVGTVIGGLLGSVFGSMGGEYVFGNIAKQLLSVAPDKALENAYNYLGVQPGAESRVLNKAYHKLALTHHPDKPEGSDAKWETLNTHIEVIKVARECGRDTSTHSGNDEL